MNYVRIFLIALGAFVFLGCGVLPSAPAMDSGDAGTTPDGTGIQGPNMPTTPIDRSLKLQSSDPPNNERLSIAPSTITIRFSRGIVLAQPSLINLSGGSGQIDDISVRSSSLRISVSGLSDAEYTISIPARAIEDRNGTPLESEEAIRFTIDTTAPVFESSTPSDFATLEGNRVVLSYSEDIVIRDGTAITMSGGPGSITSRSVVNNELILELSGLEGGGYFIDIPVSAISDRAGNPPSRSTSLIFFVN